VLLPTVTGNEMRHITDPQACIEGLTQLGEGIFSLVVLKQGASRADNIMYDTASLRGQLDPSPMSTARSSVGALSTSRIAPSSITTAQYEYIGDYLQRAINAGNFFNDLAKLGAVPAIIWGIIQTVQGCQSTPELLENQN
jgi:hypothetical protein